MLELCNVCSAYGGREALSEISLRFEPGEVLVIIGPNGSGKSTLLRTALGLQPKTAGEILLDGQPLEQFSPRQTARKISYLPQFRNVPDITVQRLVMHGRFPHMGYPRRYTAQDRKIVARALDRAGIPDLAARPIKSLSGGQRQKAYLAMTLAQESETLLLDEPTTYLDVRHQLQLAALARVLASEGKAVVLVLHELPLAFRVADRIALLDGGRLIALAVPEALFSDQILAELFGVTLRRVRDEGGWQYYYSIHADLEG
ncbi:MAG: ABC transporter ATP-binding protein [Oscillospiraceae bacterium]|nr:ABC transporter ATP-binding protein [Oscillospiraceae bacterium]